MTEISGYELLTQIGSGRRGTVWKARNLTTQRIVALKTLREGVRATRDEAARFLALAQTPLKLRHCRMVELFDAGDQGGVCYYAMELIDGYSVADWVRRKSHLRESDAVVVAHYVAAALEFAWRESGLVHGDLKPGNLFVVADGTIKVSESAVSDALARILEEREPGILLGNAHYLSPEQASSDSDATPQSDMYALGATLYQIVTGRRLFEGKRAHEILVAQVTGSVEDPRALVPDLSDGFVELLARLLAKRPGDRFASWREVADALVQVESGETPSKVRVAPLSSTLSIERRGAGRGAEPAVPDRAGRQVTETGAAAPGGSVANSSFDRIFGARSVTAATIVVGLVCVSLVAERIARVIGAPPAVEMHSQQSGPETTAGISPLPTGGMTAQVIPDPIHKDDGEAEAPRREAPPTINSGQPVIQPDPPEPPDQPVVGPDDDLLLAQLVAAASLEKGREHAAAALREAAAETEHQEARRAFTALAERLQALPDPEEYIKESFLAQQGEDVTVELRERTQSLNIQSIGDGTVSGLRDVTMMEAPLRIPVSFSFSDLSDDEREQRSRTRNADATGLLQGLAALAAGDQTRARNAFSGMTGYPSDWLVDLLTSSVEKPAPNVASVGKSPSTAATAPPEAPTTPAAFERTMRKAGYTFTAIRAGLGGATAAAVVRLDRRSAAGYAVYLSHEKQASGYVYMDVDGRIERNGREIGRMATDARLLLTPAGIAFFIDGAPVTDGKAGWQASWVSDKAGTTPSVEGEDVQRLILYDGFMRSDLLQSLWSSDSGTWQMNRYGGGLPTTVAQAQNARFARSVNAFTVLGEGTGRLVYGDVPLLHGQAEARFYFGLPSRVGVPDNQTVPSGTDMLVAIGDPDTAAVAFGWHGASGTFALLTRANGEAWRVEKTTAVGRPPLTSWVKIGLAIEYGHYIRAYLDDVEVLSHDAATMVCGPVSIVCGVDPVEVDDVRAWTFPRSVQPGTPTYVKSRNFSFKEEKNEGGMQKDPKEFMQWAKSGASFVTEECRLAGARTGLSMRNRGPLFGDVSYESVPYHQDAGELPEGDYELRVWRAADKTGASGKALARPMFSLRMRRRENAWHAQGLPANVWPRGHSEFALRLLRSKATHWRVALRVKSSWLPLSSPFEGPIMIEVVRVVSTLPGSEKVEAPHPEHHVIRCRNLVHEFFETAPTDWSWIDGRFRMRSRWACSGEWNFMGCASLGVPFMVSKRTFNGNQEHDYYISLRGVTPRDTGDATFPRADIARLFKKYGGWYNRRDLNFAFCSDGYDPMSGYAIVFGGHDNTETLLLRRGQILARTTEPDFLFPTVGSNSDRRHWNIHWKWWHFRVRKQGRRILVSLYDKTIFDVVDPQPLSGGRIGFWSVRNGFTLSLVNSRAADIGWDPQPLYVTSDEPSEWRPLITDSLTLQQQPGPHHTRAQLNVGAGFAGLRYTFNEPVDLRATPRLALPLRLPRDARMNLYCDISGVGYVVKINAPVERVKSLLTPEYETGDQCQQPVLEPDELRRTKLLGSVKASGVVTIDLLSALRALDVDVAEPQLRSLTLGNTSNEQYLLAGVGGNNAGVTYEVGTPELKP